MNLKPVYPAGGNTTGFILAGLLLAFGMGLMQPAIGLLNTLAGGALNMAQQARANGG